MSDTDIKFNGWIKDLIGCILYFILVYCMIIFASALVVYKLYCYIYIVSLTI